MHLFPIVIFKFPFATGIAKENTAAILLPEGVVSPLRADLACRVLKTRRV